MFPSRRRLAIRIALPFAILGLALVLRAAAAVEIPALRPSAPPDFTADLVLSLDSEGRPAMGVSISVAYQSLQWIRLEAPPLSGRYAAGVEISAAFEPRAGPLRGDVWERRLVVANFDATRAPRATVVERRTFEIPPGRYRVTVRVRDINAGIDSEATQSIVVPDYSKVPVGFADLELGVADSSGAFRPVTTRIYGIDVRQLAARAALFDRRPGSWPRRYSFQYRVLDDIGARLIEGSAEVQVNRSAEPVLIRPPPTDLFVGHYVLEVELVEGKSRWRVDRSFDVEESGPPPGQEYSRMLEPLSYIARSEEIEYLRSLPPERQGEGWEEFWTRRDPTPDTPRNEALIEFIRRVHHAERQFQGYGPGWRSDMGRIYIRYGPPDQIETRPASSERPQLEVWHYQNPFRTFVFGDREGFGRYTLLSPVGE